MIKTKQLWRTCIALIATMFLGMSIQAQVNYTQNWNVSGLASWTNATGGGSGSQTTTTPCAVGSVRKNQYISSTNTANWRFTSPSLGTSNGGPTTISFDYKLINFTGGGATPNTPNWGTIVVEWATSTAGPWTAFRTINNTNHVASTSCATISDVITPTAASPLYIRFNCNIPSGTADYYVYLDNFSAVESAGPCSGAPTGGTTNGPASACTGSSFSLSVTGATDPAQTGLSYLWESADDAGFTTNVQSLGTAATQSTSQTAAKYYRRTITCTNSGLSDYSSVLSVPMSSFLNCYCAAVPLSVDANGATNITIGSWSNPNVATTPYQNFTSVSPTTLYQGSTNSTTIELQTGYTYRCRVFIDLNQDGDYNDADEMNDLGTSSSANPTTQTGNIIIPVTAITGTTGMRLVVTDDETINNPCYSGSWANVEDYQVIIATPPACSGSPIATTASASNGTICPGGSSTLSVTSPGIETGYTYQWESFDGTNWNPISGANASTYVVAPTATTDYRCVITCTNSSLSTPSSTTTVTFDASADAGTISGPTSGSTYQTLAYSTGAYLGDLQWQTATNPAGPWSDVAAATTDNVSLISNAAGTFYVRLRAASATCTTFSNVIMVVVTIPNDNVCNALPLTLGTVAAPVVNGPYTNVGATTEAGEAQAPTTGCATQTGWCAAPSGTISNSIWFSFVAPASGRVSFELDPTNYWDSQIALWSASACGDLTSGAGTLVAANDDIAGSPYHSKILATCLTPGVTYYVQVDGYGTTTNSNILLLLNDEGGRTAAISGTTTICEGTSTDLTINFGGTAPWTYSINGGAPVTTSSNPEIISVSPLTTTSYTISSVDASCPVEWSGSADITVNPLPSVEAQDVSGCPGSNITLLGTPAGGTFTAAAGTVTGNLYNGPATTYYYTYTDMNGCTNTSATHNILPTVLNPVTGITFGTITGNTAAITWNAVAGAAWYTLRYRVVGGSTWIFATSNTTSITLTGLTPASDYELEARANCSVLAPGVYGSYTTFSTGAACAAPTGMAVVPVTGSNGTKVKLTFTSNIAAGWHVLRYRIASSSNAWSVISPANGAGTTITGLTASTQYEYQLQSKCSATNIGAWTAVDYFTTGGNPSKEMNEVVETYVSNVSIYPNPTRDVLNIELSAVENASTVVKVFDMSGRLVKQIQANTEKGTNNLVIDLKDVTNGIYTVQVLENGKLTNVTKVTKQD